MIRKWIDRVLEPVLAFLMAALLIDVLWQVFSRFVLSSPSSFTDELAGHLLIWVGLLGAAYVSGRHEHLAIDLLLQKISPRKKKKLQIFIYAMVFLFAVFVLLLGGSWLVYTRFQLSVTSATLQINMGIVYMVLPLSGLLIAYYAVDDAINSLKQGEGK